jgi:hypothetical protein
MSMAKARSGLASFFCIVACMTCTKVTRVKKKKGKGKGTSCQQTYVQLQCEVPLEPSSMDCPSEKDYKIVLQAEYKQGFKYKNNHTHTKKKALQDLSIKNLTKKVTYNHKEQAK